MTTDTTDTTTVPTTGDVLPNGATVIAVRRVNSEEAAVLAHAIGHEFATWLMPVGEPERTWAGHYFPYTADNGADPQGRRIRLAPMPPIEAALEDAVRDWRTRA